MKSTSIAVSSSPSTGLQRNSQCFDAHIVTRRKTGTTSMRIVGRAMAFSRGAKSASGSDSETIAQRDANGNSDTPASQAS